MINILLVYIHYIVFLIKLIIKKTNFIYYNLIILFIGEIN